MFPAPLKAPAFRGQTQIRETTCPRPLLFLRGRRGLWGDFGENDSTGHFLEFLLELLEALFDLFGLLLQFLTAMAQAFDFLVGGVFRHGQMQGRQKRIISRNPNTCQRNRAVRETVMWFW